MAAAAGAEQPTTAIDLHDFRIRPATTEGKHTPRKDYVFFNWKVSVTSKIRFTTFIDEWTLAQNVEQGLVSTEIQNTLLKIRKGPYEYNNLAQKYLKKTAELAKSFNHVLNTQ